MIAVTDEGRNSTMMMTNTMRCTARYDDDALRNADVRCMTKGREVMTKIDEAVRNCAIDSKDN